MTPSFGRERTSIERTRGRPRRGGGAAARRELARATRVEKSARAFGSASRWIVMCNLANELELERLAASLSYTCATTLSLEETIDGCRCDDRVVELAPSSKRAVLKLRASIMEELDDLFPPWNELEDDTTWSAKCKRPESCRRQHGSIKHAVYQVGWDGYITLPPWRLGREDAMSESFAEKVNTCKFCKDTFADEYRTCRQRIWRWVPGLLGMKESWAPNQL
jgi:hypothetical protein